MTRGQLEHIVRAAAYIVDDVESTLRQRLSATGLPDELRRVAGGRVTRLFAGERL